LRGQRRTAYRVTSGQQLEDRIISNTRCIVTISIAEHPLLKNLLTGMLHLGGLTIVSETGGHRCAQSQAFITRFEQHRATI